MNGDRQIGLTVVVKISDGGGGGVGHIQRRRTRAVPAVRSPQDAHRGSRLRGGT